MAGIGIQEVTTVTITTTDRQKIEKGDSILICVKGQDVVCKFLGLDKSGYFVTQPFLSGSEPVKYRVSSIEQCFKLTSFVWVDKRNNPGDSQKDGNIQKVEES